MIVSFDPQSVIIEDKMYKFVLEPHPILPHPLSLLLPGEGKGGSQLYRYFD